MMTASYVKTSFFSRNFHGNHSWWRFKPPGRDGIHWKLFIQMRNSRQHCCLEDLIRRHECMLPTYERPGTIPIQLALSKIMSLTSNDFLVPVSLRLRECSLKKAPYNASLPSGWPLLAAYSDRVHINSSDTSTGMDCILLISKGWIPLSTMREKGVMQFEEDEKRTRNEKKKRIADRLGLGRGNTENAERWEEKSRERKPQDGRYK